MEDRRLLAVFNVDSALDTVDANVGDGLAEDASGNTTLRAAIMEANAASDTDTINLPAGTYDLTLSGFGENLAATGDLDITEGVILVGAGADTTIIDASAVGDRIFDLRDDAIVEVHHLTLTGGQAGLTSISEGYGGAIRTVVNNRLTVTDCTFYDNEAMYPGSGSGGAIFVREKFLTVENCRFTDNHAAHAGGAIRAYGASEGQASILNSTFSGNSARSGGAVSASDPLTIEGSTFYGNFGSVPNGGSGGAVDGDDMTIINSTFSNNSGLCGGAISVWGDSLDLLNCTITGNSSSKRGGGVYISTASPATATIGNTIIADNSATSDGPDVYGPVTSRGGNLVGNPTSGGFSAPSDLLGVDPKLGPLADNGGPTETYALLPGSPAIDAAITASAPARDQRGFARTVGGNADIGAFESAQLILDIAVDSVSEAAGAAATTGSVTRGVGTAGDLVVNLLSSDMSEATVPATVTIPSGSTSATFNIDAVDDAIVDGPQSVTIMAALAEFIDSGDTLEVTDDESHDFGDAPAPYPTLLAEDGARHTPTGPTLGSARDLEADGTPSASADGDDTTGTIDDEDGVTFGSIQVGQLGATVTVNVQNAPSGAKLDAWIDFNGDGSWGGPGEQIAECVAVVNGDNLIAFDVPSWAMEGETYARFRLSTAGDLAPTGAATDGEVEDYQVTIVRPEAASGTFLAHTISENADGAASVFAADLDDDGDMDILSASRTDGKIAWYENNGSETFAAKTITTSAAGANSVFVTDVDGDGDKDVLSASIYDDKIAWYENDGAQNFSARTVDAAGDMAMSVTAADVDGDGDMDLVSASAGADRVAWFENDGSGGFAIHVITTTANSAVSVTVVDLDGDGDVDVIPAAAGLPRIEWYENDGTGAFTVHTATNYPVGIWSIVAVDMDADGDMDLLSVDSNNDTVDWHENDGNESFTTHRIGDSGGHARSVFAADVDGDGDLDALCAGSISVTWHENDGSQSFTTHEIATPVYEAYSVIAADVDADGDLDVLATSLNADKITWYENLPIPPNFTVTETAGQTWVSETGVTDTFDVVLNVRPTASVVITVTSANTAEVTVDKTSLTFTPANWDTAQTIRVNGLDDFIDDGDQTILVTLSVDDANSDNLFDDVADQTVSVRNVDEDEAGITLRPESLTTTEAGGSATFTIALDSEPTETVVIDVSSSNTAEGTVAPATLTFEPGIWPQVLTVTVTGVDDDVDDGDVDYTIVTAAAVSDDAKYTDMNAVDVAVVNEDDDTVGFTLFPLSVTVSETGSSATFRVRLDSQPASDVVLTFASGDTDEVTVDDSSLTFTATDWDTQQIVTVTGVDDLLIDGHQTTAITVSVDAANSDDAFDSLPAQTVTVTTRDDDNVPPVAVSDEYIVAEGVTLTVLDSSYGVLANDSDAEGSPITARLADPPLHGSLMFSADGTFEYTPDAGFRGTDQFTYYANDGVVDSDQPGVVRLRVEPPWLVKDIGVGDTDVDYRYLTDVDGTLFFRADDDRGYARLWKSDGTTSGTTIVTEKTLGRTPAYLTNVNGTVYFSGCGSDTGRELWKSDGTEQGTELVDDLVYGESSSNPTNLTDVNGTLYFTAIGDLWKTTGTQGGAVLVKDIGAANLTNADGTLYFVSGGELWTSDGTGSGTVMVKDIVTGGDSDPEYLTPMNGHLYFRANDRLWRTDGTEAGTRMVPNVYYPRDLVAMNGTLYFLSSSDLWKLDETDFIGVRIRDLPGDGLYAADLMKAGDTLYFTDGDDTTGRELWKSDGTEAGTVHVKDIYPGSPSSGIESMTGAGGTLYFSAWDGANGRELWMSDGTEAGTVIAADIGFGGSYSWPEDLTSVNGRLYFTAYDDAMGRELWLMAPGQGDLGDAPSPYLTLLADGGAQHTIVGGLFLGNGVDGEADGQPDAAATGDDLDTSDDDDGVVFTSPIIPGLVATIDVSASASGYLNAWIDFNADGDWDDGAEQIFRNRPLNAGVNHLAFQVPAAAAFTEQTFSRFRFNSSGGLSYDGAAADGEVEDYAVAIGTDELTVTFDPEWIAENAGQKASIGTVTRNTGTVGDLQVLLASSDESELRAPAEVTIPHGLSSVSFYLTAVNDGDVDGTQFVTITASADGHTDGSGTAYVTDDDGDALTVTIVADAVSEADGTGATLVGVTRSEVTRYPLTVRLASNDTTEAIVPATVTIPAGQATVTFEVETVDDEIDDGTQTVTLTASAELSVPMDRISEATAPSLIYDLAVLPDGKIIAAGKYGTGTDSDFGILRYSADGTLDVTFGTAGMVTTDPSGVSDWADCVALQNDGRFVAAGSSWVVRYHADGSLDTTFDGDGIAASLLDSVLDVAVQDDGRVLIVGQDSNRFAVARYNADGTPDDTFGTGGIITDTFAAISEARVLGLQSDGKIIAAGYRYGQLLVARYDASGQLDQDFGSSGTVSTDFYTGIETVDLVVHPDDQLTICAWARISFELRSVLVQYESDGSSTSILKLGGTPSAADNFAIDLGVALQRDGRIVTSAINIGDNIPQWIGVSRYYPDGQFDTLSSATAMSSSQVIPTVAVQPSGAIVYGGSGLERYSGTAVFEASDTLDVTDDDTAGITVMAVGPHAMFPGEMADAGTGYAEDMTLADFNEDGYVDVATIDRVDGEFSVLLSRGDGSFEDRVRYRTGTLYAIASGDMDGDGHVDLIAAGRVYRGLGDGTFETTGVRWGSFNFMDIAVADVDGDGALDVVAVDYTDLLTFHAGVGDGTFEPRVQFTVGDGARAIGVGDVNGDGHLDLVTANSLEDDVSVLFGQGSRTFAGQQRYAVGTYPYSVELADLNGDEQLDLAVTNHHGGSASLLMGLGDGTFSDQVAHATGTNPSATLAYDINRDGRVDLLVANRVSHYLSVLQGQGDGTFVATSRLPTGSGPDRLTLGDLTNDGRDDLAVLCTGSDTVATHLAQEDGTFAFPTYYPTIDTPRELVLADFNNDGHLDAVTANTSYDDQNHHSTVSVRLGLGDGTFGAETSYDVPTYSHFPVTGDFNEDGFLDVVVVSSNFLRWSTFLGRGDGTFDVSTYPLSEIELPYHVADFDNDGHLDILTRGSSRTGSASYIWIHRGDGEGSFQRAHTMLVEASRIPNTPYPVPFVEDFNEDGELDLVIGPIGGEILTYAGNGDGTFLAPRRSGRNILRIMQTVGDLNEDGHDDLIARASDGPVLLLGDGDGTFTTRKAPRLSWSLVDAVITDLNGDGHDDVMTQIFGHGEVSLGNGNGTLAGIGQYATGSHCYDFSVGDLNEDGWQDLVFPDQGTDNVSVLLQNSHEPLTTHETGDATRFTVVLDSEPTADVTVTVVPDDETEGTASLGELTFTPDNWNVPQTVTITGIDDNVDDGDIQFSVVLDSGTSSDAGYSAIAPENVTVTNVDDDTAGIIVEPTSGLVTTEGNGWATFTVVLNSEPTDDVTIAVTSTDTTEGTVSDDSLTFTPQDWATPKTVTVTGADDAIEDGDIAYTIVLDSVTSSDGKYSVIDPDDVTVTNEDDNDKARIIVTPTSGLVTTEGAGWATFTVVLASEPTDDVTIAVTSSNTTEGTVADGTLTFTAQDWATPRTITVTGVDDDVDDGDIDYTIVLDSVTTTDENYAAIDPDDVAVSNTDDDTVGFVISATAGYTEAWEGGPADTLEIVLRSKPLSDVVITIANSNPGEISVDAASLTFTSANWNTRQMVAITATDDSALDGHQTAQLTFAVDDDNSDDTFDSLDDQVVQVIARDNDCLVVTTLDDELDADLSDPDDLSLREALALAADEGLHAGADTIIFSAALDLDATPGEIELTEGQLAIDSDVTILGPGASQLAIDADADDDGTGESRVFYVGPGVTATLDGITVSGGHTSQSGGGIYVDSSTLTVVNCEISDNEATEYGGGIRTSGGTLTVNASLISGNVADYGAGISNDDGALSISGSTIEENSATTGGGILTSGEQVVRISDSTVSNNSANTGGGIYSSRGTLIVANSTFTGNVAGHAGGGVFCAYGSLTMSGSTVRGNQAETGNAGGIYTTFTDEVTISNSLIVENSGMSAGGLIANSGALNVVNSTISGNSAYFEGGGIYSHSEATLTLANSIVALNRDASNGEIWSDSIIPGGRNLIGVDPHFVQAPSPGGDGTWGTADDVQGDYRLTAQSPAIDAGSDLYLDEIDSDGAGPDVEIDLDGSGVIGDFTIASDLEGQARSYGNGVDIGVYEFQAAAEPGRETPSSVVTTLDDTVDLYDGLISLREAVFYSDLEALAGPISFDASLDRGQMSLAGRSLVLHQPVVIDATALDSLALDGQRQSRVLTVLADDVAVYGLDIQNGTAQSGGGIFNSSGRLSLIGCAVSGHDAGWRGGGIFNAEGTFAAIDCAIQANEAHQGGGVFNSDGTVILTNSLVTGNRGNAGGGIASYDTATLIAANSTISGNAGVSEGGGIHADGIEYLYNTTVAGNSAPSGTDVFDEIDGGYHNLIGDGTDMTGLVDGTDGNQVGTAASPVDPRFVDIQTYSDIVGADQLFGTGDDGPVGDYRLLLGSPAIDAGSSLYLDESDSDGAGPDVEIDLNGSGSIGDYTVAYDLAGRPRLAGTGVEIGGYEVTLDFGDAPAPYATTFAEDGARHVVTGPMLGTARDPEADGTHSAADFDDLMGIVDDEDGIFFTSILAPGQLATVDVTVSADAILNAWIDFNGDGDWMDTGEWILTEDGVLAGVNARSFLAPADAVLTDQTFARFRVSSVSGLSFAGEAPDGEVEDYAVAIEPAALTLTIDPTSISENGGTATATVTRYTGAVGDLVVNVVSSDLTEASVPATVTIADGSSSVSFAIDAVDDHVEDGTQTVSITASAAGFTDGVDEIDITNDDVAGISVDPTSELMTDESGGWTIFTVTLDSEPTSDVTIAVASSDTTEGTVSTDELTFTPLTWMTPQTVTVTGVDDHVDDGDIPYTIVLDSVTSSDDNYATIDPDDVSVTNEDDNDEARIIVTPTSDLVTTEGNGWTTFTVVLNSEPTSNVTIAVTSSDTTEGDVSDNTLTFTPLDWATPQTVTVTGVNDDIEDGDIPYIIVLDSVTSSDTKYSAIDPDDLAAVNSDDDYAGIFVDPTAELMTDESGDWSTFSVTLSSEPTSDVTIAVASSDTTEGTVSADELTFTPLTWMTPQTVTVTGVDDHVEDGDIPYTIVLGPVTSSDGKYSVIDPEDVLVININDDTAGIFVDPTSELTTTEDAGWATFTVVLNSEPTSDVTVPLSSSNMVEGTVSPSMLVFTAENWHEPQTARVTGVGDNVDDGDVDYTIKLGAVNSDDQDYASIDPDDVTVTNLDDDTADVTVTWLSPAVTTESGGTTAFDVVLVTEPITDVTVTVSSDDVTEGSASPASLVFTSLNWNEPQTVDVTGIDDDVDDDDVTYTIVTEISSTDPVYNNLDVTDATVTNQDDDTAGVLVAAVSGLTTSESDGKDAFTVVLKSEPVSDVTVTAASDDTSEGIVPLSSLVFTSLNWNVPQGLTITGVDDDVDDGDVTYTIVTDASSNDPIYNKLDVTDVTVTNLDDDTAGITVAPTSGLTTKETGDTAEFTVVLDSEPTADVTIGVTSDDTTEGTTSTTELIFTPTTWQQPQTVTITGVDDSLDDDDVAYTIVTAAAVSDDPNYDSFNADDVAVTNVDDETFVPIELGLVDFKLLEALDPSAGELWFRLETAHDAWLTVQSDAEWTADQLTLSLYDPNDLSTPLVGSNASDAVPRIDHLVQQGQVYLIKVTGSASDVNLLIANLVHEAGAAITVHGTAENDILVFDAAASREITINGVAYHYEDTEVSMVDFNGAGGRDEAWLYDSAGDETVEAWPDRAVFANETDDGVPDYTVNVTHIEDLQAYATRGGTDAAVFHGSEAADKLKSYEDSVRLRAKDSSYTTRAKKYDTIVSDGGPAGKDLAVFNGSDLDDTFTYVGADNSARFEGKRRDHTALGFGSVVVRAGGGENDIAHFTDLPGPAEGTDDIFYFKSHKTVLVNHNVKVTARAFDEIHATASESGFDVARIYDTLGDDHLEVAGNTAKLYRRIGDDLDLLYEAVAFERVKAYSTEGNDTTDIKDHTIDLILNGWDE